MEPDAVVTTGLTGGFLLAFLSKLRRRRPVAVTSPATLLSQHPVGVGLRGGRGAVRTGETRFSSRTVAMFRALDPPVKGLIIASLANPTGTSRRPVDLAAIALAGVTPTGVNPVSDEIYHGPVYPGAPATSCVGDVAQCHRGEQFFEVLRDDGLALGLAAGAFESLRRAVDCSTGNFSICPPTPPQLAAVVAAFDPGVAGHRRRALVQSTR